MTIIGRYIKRGRDEHVPHAKIIYRDVEIGIYKK